MPATEASSTSRRREQILERKERSGWLFVMIKDSWNWLQKPRPQVLGSRHYDVLSSALIRGNSSKTVQSRNRERRVRGFLRDRGSGGEEACQRERRSLLRTIISGLTSVSRRGARCKSSARFARRKNLTRIPVPEAAVKLTEKNLDG